MDKDTYEPLLDGTFDYVTKNGYVEYNKTLESISDDPSTLDQDLAELKLAYRTRVTREYEFRVAQLLSLQRGLEENKEELCGAIEKDLGRGQFYAYISEIHLLKVEIQHSIDHLKTWMRETVVDTPVMVGPGKSYVKPEPLGVICVMAAWNYPYYTLMGPVSQVIAAGNCCVIKPSELSPNCAIAIGKIVMKYLDPRFYKLI
jgi:aldehyde dehydrogenase (NAD+)